MEDEYFDALCWWHPDWYIEEVLIGTLVKRMWRGHLKRRYRKGYTVQLTTTWYVRKLAPYTTDGVLYQEV
jgi:hypothetical protein